MNTNFIKQTDLQTKQNEIKSYIVDKKDYFKNLISNYISSKYSQERWNYLYLLYKCTDSFHIEDPQYGKILFRFSIEKSETVSSINLAIGIPVVLPHQENSHFEHGDSWVERDKIKMADCAGLPDHILPNWSAIQWK